MFATSIGSPVFLQIGENLEKCPIMRHSLKVACYATIQCYSEFFEAVVIRHCSKVQPELNAVVGNIDIRRVRIIVIAKVKP